MTERFFHKGKFKYFVRTFRGGLKGRLVKNNNTTDAGEKGSLLRNHSVLWPKKDEIKIKIFS